MELTIRSSLDFPTFPQLNMSNGSPALDAFRLRFLRISAKHSRLISLSASPCIFKSSLSPQHVL